METLDNILKAIKAKNKYRRIILTEFAEKKRKTKKDRMLMYMMEGRPTSMLLAIKKFGIGCYRDVIYELKKEGWDIVWYSKEIKNDFGRSIFHCHYLADFPESYIKSREEF